MKSFNSVADEVLWNWYLFLCQLFLPPNLSTLSNHQHHYFGQSTIHKLIHLWSIHEDYWYKKREIPQSEISSYYGLLLVHVLSYLHDVWFNCVCELLLSTYSDAIWELTRRSPIRWCKAEIIWNILKVSNRLSSVTDSTNEVQLSVVSSPMTRVVPRPIRDNASMHPPTQIYFTVCLPTTGGGVSFEAKSSIVTPTTKYILLNLWNENKS